MFGVAWYGMLCVLCCSSYFVSFAGLMLEFMLMVSDIVNRFT